MTEAGVDLLYIVPRCWPESDSEPTLSSEPFRIVEVDVRRPGDINRHAFVDADQVTRLIMGHHPDVVDLLEEPYSVATAQLLQRLPADIPVVAYSAQNLDKRWPPPFAGYERAALQRVQAFYPCSSQAASVLRGKGFGGLIRPIPLGYEPSHFRPGAQTIDDEPLQLALVGRMTAYKGVADAIEVIRRLHHRHGIQAHLVLAGDGPALASALAQAAEVGLEAFVTHEPWTSTEKLSATYRRSHVLLAPSRATATWAEQFGRTVLEAQASGCVVVGYQSGSIPEVGGPPALLAPEGDIDSLTDAVLSCLTNATFYKAHREAGLTQSEGRSWSQVAANHIEVYQAALLRPPGPLLLTSPRALRAKAIEEFGRPATALGQQRPFALPGLRKPSVLSRIAGSVTDTVAELASAVREAGN